MNSKVGFDGLITSGKFGLKYVLNLFLLYKSYRAEKKKNKFKSTERQRGKRSNKQYTETVINALTFTRSGSHSIFSIGDRCLDLVNVKRNSNGRGIYVQLHKQTHVCVLFVICDAYEIDTIHPRLDRACDLIMHGSPLRAIAARSDIRKK